MKINSKVNQLRSLNVNEEVRYSRHILIPEFGVKGQEKLINAKILCIGAGGLGSNVLMYLSAAGVGVIGVIDSDFVSISNLPRQVIHTEANLGKLKVESAKKSINLLNSTVEIEIYPYSLNRGNVLEIINRYDIIIDCTDNFATRYLANDACIVLNKPYIWGSIFQFDGQVSVFWADKGPCYRCLHPSAPVGSVPSCAEGGVLGVMCSTIGSIQATEAIKLITGIGKTLVGSLLVYDALNISFNKIPLKKNPQCSVCSKLPNPNALLDDYESFCGITNDPEELIIQKNQIDAAELQSILRNIDIINSILLIDVREPEEHAFVRIPGSLLIPRARFLDGSAFHDIPLDKKVILYCKSGHRSLECLNLLIDSGHKNSTHLAGGVLGWIKEIDPLLPTY